MKQLIQITLSGELQGLTKSCKLLLPPWNPLQRLKVCRKQIKRQHTCILTPDLSPSWSQHVLCFWFCLRVFERNSSCLVSRMPRHVLEAPVNVGLWQLQAIHPSGRPISRARFTIWQKTTCIDTPSINNGGREGWNRSLTILSMQT